jgi:geranylgeranyl diphosphate synthase type II
MTGGEFKLQYDQRRMFVEKSLETLCASTMPHVPPRLLASMAYSLKAGGKRLRPVLCLKAGEIFGLEREKVIPLALALEMIHTASLIHDDLPAMDDDILRRGKPTNHVLFGDALAILAGDALMAWAFEYPLSILPGLGLPSDRICNAMLVLANALGPSGICGGQVLDIDDQSMEESPDFPWKVTRQKTAVLLRSSILSGAILAGADEESLKALGTYGDHLGIAFQIVDDILDVISTADELGKTPGKDESQNKRTFVAAYGLERARVIAGEESALAVAALEGVRGETSFFSDLSEYLCERTK